MARRIRSSEKKSLIPKQYKYLINIIWGASFFIAIGLAAAYFAINFNEAYSIAFRNVNDYIPTVITILFVFFSTRLLLLIMKPLFMLLVKVNLIKHADMKVIFQIFSTVIWMIAAVIIFYAVVGSIEGLGITVGVIIGALVFVLGKPLMNLFGWLIIIFRRPVKLGDRIRVQYEDSIVEGDVVEVSMFYTYIRESGAWLRGEELTGRMITLPNSALLDKPFYNFTKASPHIWDRLTVTITYDSDHKKAKEIMLTGAKLAMKHLGNDAVDEFNENLELMDMRTHVLKEPEVEFQLAPSGITLELLYLTHCRERGLMESVITEYILNEVSKNPDVRFAYPHVAVSAGHDPIPMGGSVKIEKRTGGEDESNVLSKFSGLVSGKIGNVDISNLGVPRPMDDGKGKQMIPKPKQAIPKKIPKAKPGTKKNGSNGPIKKKGPKRKKSNDDYLN